MILILENMALGIQAKEIEGVSIVKIYTLLLMLFAAVPAMGAHTKNLAAVNSDNKQQRIRISSKDLGSINRAKSSAGTLAASTAVATAAPAQKAERARKVLWTEEITIVDKGLATKDPKLEVEYVKVKFGRYRYYKIVYRQIEKNGNTVTASRTVDQNFNCKGYDCAGTTGEVMKAYIGLKDAFVKAKSRRTVQDTMEKPPIIDALATL